MQNLRKWCRIPPGLELKFKNVFIVTLLAILLCGRHWYSGACPPEYPLFSFHIFKFLFLFVYFVDVY